MSDVPKATNDVYIGVKQVYIQSIPNLRLDRWCNNSVHFHITLNLFSVLVYFNQLSVSCKIFAVFPFSANQRHLSAIRIRH